jgi:hypothetical protein
VRGLGKISGRKVVFFLSDGLPIRTRRGTGRQALDALRDLTDAANRASVVFNTIDARGLIIPGMVGAGDNVSVSDEIVPGKPSGTDKLFNDRTAEVQNTRDGLNFLAVETGGEFTKNRIFLMFRFDALEFGKRLLSARLRAGRRNFQKQGFQ